MLSGMTVQLYNIGHTCLPDHAVTEHIWDTKHCWLDGEMLIPGVVQHRHYCACVAVLGTQLFIMSKVLMSCSCTSIGQATTTALTLAIVPA